MADYTISFARSARKQLQSLDRAIALRIIARIEALAAAPRPPGCVKLTGEFPGHRQAGPAKECFLFMKDPDGIRFEVTYYPPGASVVD